MKSENRALKPMKRHHKRDVVKKWSGLQFRMTVSFVGVAVVTALLLELLLSAMFLKCG